MMRLILITILAISAKCVYGRALEANQCKETGLFALADNTPQFYGCFETTDGQLSLVYLTCFDGGVFNTAQGTCIASSKANNLSIRDSGGSEIEYPTSPSPSSSTSGSDIEHPTIPTQAPSASTVVSSTSSSASTEGLESTTEESGSSSESTDAPEESTTEGSENSSESSETPESTTEESESSSESSEAPESSTEESGGESTEAPEESTTEESESSSESSEAPESSTEGSGSESTEAPEESTTEESGSSSESSEAPESSTEGSESGSESTEAPGESTTVAVSTTTPEPFKCPSSGFFPDDSYDICNKFIYCTIVDGVSTYFNLDCPSGQQYNPASGFCEADFNCKIESNQLSKQLNNDIQCLVEGIFHDPKDCTKFYTCSWDEKVEAFEYSPSRCQNGEVFNLLTGMCAEELPLTCLGRVKGSRFANRN